MSPFFLCIFCIGALQICHAIDIQCHNARGLSASECMQTLALLGNTMRFGGPGRRKFISQPRNEYQWGCGRTWAGPGCNIMIDCRKDSFAHWISMPEVYELAGDAIGHCMGSHGNLGTAHRATARLDLDSRWWIQIYENPPPFPWWQGYCYPWTYEFSKHHPRLTK